MFDGTWKLEGNTVSHTSLFGDHKSVWTFDAIQEALDNVSRNRDFYTTEEAWREHMNHLERGRLLFLFDPMTDIPTNDTEAEIAIKYHKNDIVSEAGWGLYQIYRERDGASVIQAYERALLAILGAPHKPILS